MKKQKTSSSKVSELVGRNQDVTLGSLVLVDNWASLRKCWPLHAGTLSCEDPEIPHPRTAASLERVWLVLCMDCVHSSHPNPSWSSIDVCKWNSNERCLWSAFQMVGPHLRAYHALTHLFLTPYEGVGWFFLGFIFLFTAGCAGSSLLCGLFSSCREQEPVFVAELGLLFAMVSLVL